MPRAIKRTFLLAILVVLGAAWAVVSLNAPYRGFHDEVFLRIERGVGTVEIGRSLAQAGVIRYAWQFWAERALHRDGKVQAGEYQFSEAATPADVLSRLARGDVYFFEFTVKEGSNMFDIAQSLGTAGVMRAADFLEAASKPDSIRDLAPQAPSLEGYLFPSTYRLSHSTTAAELCRQMTDQFRKQWRRLIEKDVEKRRASGSAPDSDAHNEAPADVHSTVTLASLVEKETGLANERAIVAGVFANRLKRGMKLDCDPTTVYASLLEHRFRGVIYKSDLASKNAYNTYQNAGLPPGPIANPGADSLAAALHPAETDYLYFVAKPNGGGHQFSSTLAGHERATQAYRKKARKSG
jgi:UPF0755 protein